MLRWRQAPSATFPLSLCASLDGAGVTDALPLPGNSSLAGFFDLIERRPTQKAIVPESENVIASTLKVHVGDLMALNGTKTLRVLSCIKPPD